MKMLGDVSEDDKALAEALEEAEKEIESNMILPNERKAQVYTCLAHDWYEISMEEEGNRLLLKSEQVFPGYFKGLVIQHMLEDADFDMLVKKITLELIQMMTCRLREK